MDAQVDDLVRIGSTARSKAYVRHSRFVVGAAVKCKSRAVLSGANIENRSFGLTICAERVATCAAVAGGEQDFVAIAVTADSVEPIVPCLQFLAEFNPDLIIVRTTVLGQRKIENLSHLFADATRGILKHADLT
jgi:cytidine deaminase